MKFELNPELDRAALAKRLKADRRVQIPNILKTEHAERLTECIEKEIPWSFTYYDDKGPGIIEQHNLEKVPPKDMQALQNNIYKQAIDGFGYAYGLLHQSDATRTRGEIPAVLNDFYQFLAGPEMRDFIVTVLDDSSIRQVDAQATRFGPGNFLGYHNDQMHGAHRRCAYVFNFTRRWRPDWNGYLQFFDENGNGSVAYKPGFNVLNLFKVPQAHAVACIPPYAAAYRYAVSGWYRAGVAPNSNTVQVAEADKETGIEARA